MRKIKELKNKLYLTAFYIAIIILFWCLNIPCIFKHLFNCECPGCGMTRAILSAFEFDFKDAFTFHPMFWSMPILYVYFLLDGKVIGKKFFDVFILSAIFLGFLLNWIIKFV